MHFCPECESVCYREYGELCAEECEHDCEATCSECGGLATDACGLCDRRYREGEAKQQEGPGQKCH